MNDAPTLRPPNIMLVVLDSVRADNCSAYGYSRATTPHLEALASEGVLYEQAISVGSWTLPVHASLFTGMYPLRHGLTISRHALPAGADTLARQLSALGYKTACFSNNAYISDATGLSQGFDHVDDVWRVSHPRGIALPKLQQRIRDLEGRGPLLRPLIGVLRRARRMRAILKTWRSRKDSGAALTMRRVTDWLATSGGDQPFLIFVNLMEAHEPYLPPYPYNRRFMSPRYSPWQVARATAQRHELLDAPPERRRQGLEMLEALYDGTVRYSDEIVGELTRILRSSRLLDDTVLVVTSDHGDAFGEHGHLGHRLTLYDELLRVPLVIRYPARFPAGSRVPEQVQVGDLYPTFLELAGSEAGPVEASDFQSLLADPDAERFTIAENTAPKSLDSLESRVLRESRYKLHWRANGDQELYDLVVDRAERSNLVDSRPDLAREMETRLLAWVERTRGDATATAEASYDEETLERLRGLGYVG